MLRFLHLPTWLHRLLLLTLLYYSLDLLHCLLLIFCGGCQPQKLPLHVWLAGFAWQCLRVVLLKQGVLL
jgi:hypothetical protein